MMDGRVKTLHPKIFGGYSGRRDNVGDLRSMQEENIPTIDLVVVNLYPFEATINRAGFLAMTPLNKSILAVRRSFELPPRTTNG